MGLNNIDLPAAALADLYSSSLVETGEITPAKKTATAPLPALPAETGKGTRSLGENKKNILIVVNNNEAVHISDNELTLLTSMLAACKLSLADVAIVNTNQQAASYKELLSEFSSKVCLLFAIEPSGFGLPMSFPHFQIQPFANCSFLYSPSLTELENDKVLKSKLWVCLKRLFNL
jgi:hypothetical protein